MSNNVEYEVRDLDPDRSEDVAAIARLHQELLKSGISGLGPWFIESFFYVTMVREGLIQAALCLVDGQPAGFITMTNQPGTFLGKAIRSHWPTVMIRLLATCLRQPKVLIRLLHMLRLNLFRLSNGRQDVDGTGQILAIGVQPQYRRIDFVKSTGIRLAPDLVGHMISRSIDLGLRELNVVFEKADRPLFMFYKLLGWQSERYSTASGPPMIKLFLDLDQLRPTGDTTRLRVPEST